ncbi:MAG: ribosome modulation factor [Gammaproteobacteria bacterium]|nr:ribosome modulation factor [Gammaproteobacteria bacterium]
MKRQKRDMNVRAYNRGYKAGLQGKSKDCCPHTQEDHRLEWMGGWRQAREDQWISDPNRY